MRLLIDIQAENVSRAVVGLTGRSAVSSEVLDKLSMIAQHGNDASTGFEVQGVYRVVIRPIQSGRLLFRLRRVISNGRIPHGNEFVGINVQAPEGCVGVA